MNFRTASYRHGPGTQTGGLTTIIGAADTIGAMGNGRERRQTVMADDKPGQPYPPRWVMIYLLVFALALIVWIILDALHGGLPWERPW
jgi:hypothetical protein